MPPVRPVGPPTKNVCSSVIAVCRARRREVFANVPQPQAIQLGHLGHALLPVFFKKKYCWIAVGKNLPSSQHYQMELAEMCSFSREEKTGVHALGSLGSSLPSAHFTTGPSLNGNICLIASGDPTRDEGCRSRIQGNSIPQKPTGNSTGLMGFRYHKQRAFFSRPSILIAWCEISS